MDPILFAGGDRRTFAALSYMKQRGYPAAAYALTERTPYRGKAAALILPFPCLKDGKLNAPLLPSPPTIEELLEETGTDPAKTPVFGGPLENNPFSDYTDLAQSEELKLRNAVTTAEGALALLIQNTPRAIRGMSVLIVGYGAIGKRLAVLLKALGAKVTVAARKEKDRIEGELLGYKMQDTNRLSLAGIQAVINTVPAHLFTAETLRGQEQILCFLELASPPYGADPSTVKEQKIPYLPGPALPGKIAPVTAGEDLAKTVLSLLCKPKTKGSGQTLGT